MNPENERSSAGRRWWWLLAGIVVFAVSFTVLENLGRKEPTPSETVPAPPPTPATPEVRWTEDGAIELSEEPFAPSRINLRNEEKKQQLFNCIEQGIEETFGNGTEGWDRVGVWRETQRIKNECMDSLRGVPG